MIANNPFCFKFNITEQMSEGFGASAPQVQNLTRGQIEEFKLQEANMEDVDIAIFKSAEKQHLTVTLSNEMGNNARVKNFVKSEEYEEFKQRFIDAKTWLVQEQKRCSKDKTLFDNETLNAYHENLQALAAPVKARMQKDSSFMQSWRLFTKMDKEVQKNEEILRKLVEDHQYDEIKAGFAQLKNRDLTRDMVTEIEQIEKQRSDIDAIYKSLIPAKNDGKISNSDVTKPSSKVSNAAAAK